MRAAILVVVIVALAVVGAWVAAAQPTVYPATPPSWYNQSLPNGKISKLVFSNITVFAEKLVDSSTTSGYSVVLDSNYFNTGEVYRFILGFDITSSTGTWWVRWHKAGDTAYYAFSIQLLYNGVIEVLYDSGNINGGSVSITEGKNYTVVIFWPNSTHVEICINTTPAFCSIGYANTYRDEVTMATGSGATGWVMADGVHGVPSGGEPIANIKNIVNITVNDIPAIIRAPSGQAFVSTNSTSVWLDEAFISAPGTYTFTWAPYFKLENNATLSYDEGEYNVTGPAYIAPLPNYLECGKVHVEPVLPLDNIRCYPLDPSQAVNVTFQVNQYGTNYSALQVSAPDGSIMGRRLLDAQGQAVMPLPLGASVYIYFLNKTSTKLYGALTIAGTAYAFTVLPPAPPVPSAHNVSAEFINNTLLHLWGTCPSPPCRVVVAKHNATGDFLLANLSVATESFDVKINVTDPFVTADVYTATGKFLGRAYAGATQLFNATQAQAVKDFLVFVARHTMPNGDVRLLVAIISALTFLVFTTVGSLLTGGVALAAVMAVLGWAVGWAPLSGVGVILLIATLALYYLTRKSGE